MMTCKGKASTENRIIKKVVEFNMNAQARMMKAQEDLAVSNQLLELLRRRVANGEKHAVNS